MRILKLVEFFWMIWGMVFKYNSGQDIMFVDDNEGNSGHITTSTSSDNQIPEELLIRMKDLQNAADFLKRFMKRDDFITNGTSNITDNQLPSISGRRGLAGAAAASVATPANCQSEPHIVELEKPRDTSTIMWPTCVRVRRCGGCCSSKRLSCEPTAISTLNITVFQASYNPETPESLENLSTRVFSVEQHDRCACNCKEKTDDCNPHVHHYSENDCQCICSNREQAANCTAPRKVWDSKDCRCKCRRIQLCSTGRFFNPFKCRCEISQSSLTSLN